MICKLGLFSVGVYGLEKADEHHQRNACQGDDSDKSAGFGFHKHFFTALDLA